MTIIDEFLSCISLDFHLDFKPRDYYSTTSFRRANRAETTESGTSGCRRLKLFNLRGYDGVATAGSRPEFRARRYRGQEVCLFFLLFFS